LDISDKDGPIESHRQSAGEGAVSRFVSKFRHQLSSGELELPPFPDTALRIRQALLDPDADIGKISNMVLSEPALTARLLRIANSVALRRGPMEITDVRTAIARMGFDMVQNVAISFAAREAFRSPPGTSLGRELDQLRRFSVRVATNAYVLARNTPNQLKPDEAMLAGLLHAMGKFYIITRIGEFPSLYTDPEIMDELLRVWHTDVARAIVESWGFPRFIVEAVYDQELIDQDPKGEAELADYVLLGSLLAKSLDAEDKDQAYLLQPIASVIRVGHGPESLQALMLEHEQAIESMCQSLSG